MYTRGVPSRRFARSQSASDARQSQASPVNMPMDMSHYTNSSGNRATEPILGSDIITTRMFNLML